MKIRRELLSGLLIGLLAVFAGSCLKDHTEEYQADHDAAFQALKKEFNITAEDHIGDSIFVHFTYMPEINGDTVFPEDQDYVVMDYIGLKYGGPYSEPEVFDVTSEEDAREYDLYRGDIIYGPVRLNINQTFRGFYFGIQHVPESAEATILIPHEQAFYNYEPLVYKVKLYRVIKDLQLYDSLQMMSYLDLLGISTIAENTHDITEVPKAYYKIVTEGEEYPEMEIGDTVVIKLHAYYVETDTAYVDSIPGRQFFPINQSGEEVKFAYGENYFPITPVLNVMLGYMKLNETREIVTPADYTYGEYGFIHPGVAVFIVPPYIPVHYIVTFERYIKINDFN